MSATQRVFDDAGGFRDIPTMTTMVFGGDGHNHWHLRDLERSDVIRLDNGTKAGTGAKRGFCFWVDLQLEAQGAPRVLGYGPAA
jgi:hypothetical protein